MEEDGRGGDPRGLEEPLLGSRGVPEGKIAPGWAVPELPDHSVDPYSWACTEEYARYMHITHGVDQPTPSQR